MSDAQPVGQRKTKIIATLGPASNAVEVLERMMHAGMNVVRLNLSHGDFDEHGARVERVRQAAKNLGVHVAIMVDTRGIEVRTGLLEAGPVHLEAGSRFCLYMEPQKGNAEGVSVSYSKLASGVKNGDVIEFRV